MARPLLGFRLMHAVSGPAREATPAARLRPRHPSVPGLRWAAAMMLAVAAVAGLAYADATREANVALADLGEEQTKLAHTIALRADEPSFPAFLADLERSGDLVLAFRRRGSEQWTRSSGEMLAAPALSAASAAGAHVVRLSRREAAALGLPGRTAVGGIARAPHAAETGVSEIAAIASAARLRDREASATRRLLLSVLVAAGLVVVFGGRAMRTQKKELLLEQELAVAAVRQAQAQRLERANRVAVLGTLAMGIAHEISTPLAVIAAKAEQAAPRARDDERLAAAIAVILGQTERITQIIRGLLGLARGDVPATDQVDPVSVVEHAVALVEHRFLEAGVPLSNTVSGRLPPVVGDARLLEHAVVNLLLNACDACKGGGGVEVRTELDDGNVEIIVEDAGSGISLDDAGKPGDLFFTTKPRGEGTGLGLAIAHEIVAGHRGALSFAKRSPSGTTAVIRLPMAEGGSHA